MKNDDDYLKIAWQEYNKKLLAFIRANVDSSRDAEDILSDVYFKLAKQVESVRIPDKLPNWLFRVARNTIADFYRTKKPLETLPDNLAAAIQEPQAISELSECIRPIIEDLPESFRLPLLLSEIYGKKQREVAEELGLSLSALKARILRGRKKLKNLMAKRCTFHYDESGQLVDYQEVYGSNGAEPQD